MRLRFTLKHLAGASALLALGGSIAFAQTPTKPTSTKRIPLSKEGGEVVAKTDTVTVYRTDTMTVTNTRVDTVTRTRTVTRVDTVVMVPPKPPVRLPGGFYFGVGAGVMAPNGSIFTPNSAGPSEQIQIGWSGVKSLLGARLDGNWAQPGQDSFYSGFQGDASLANFNGDLQLNLPIFNHLLGITPRFKLYGLGGFSYVAYKDLPIRLDVPCVGCIGAKRGRWSGGRIVGAIHSGLECRRWRSRSRGAASRCSPRRA